MNKHLKIFIGTFVVSTIGIELGARLFREEKVLIEKVDGTQYYGTKADYKREVDRTVRAIHASRDIVLAKIADGLVVNEEEMQMELEAQFLIQIQETE